MLGADCFIPSKLDWALSSAWLVPWSAELVDKESSEYEAQLLAEMAKAFGFDAKTAEGIQARVRGKLTTG